MIHFDEKLIGRVEELRGNSEYEDVFKDLDKIEKIITKRNFAGAQKLDNELIDKYPTINKLTKMLYTLGRTSVYTIDNLRASPILELEYLTLDKYGIYAEILLKLNYIKEIKRIINCID